jgi:hypothetical protein
MIVLAAGAGCLLPVTSSIATEVGKLVASDAAAYDQFGAVALSGDTAVVGAWLDDHVPASGLDEGSAYVFTRGLGGSGVWAEVAVLRASDAAPFDQFGWAVAVSGDTAVVGAHLADPWGIPDAGAAYVFERNQGGAGGWGEALKLTASDAGVMDHFGNAVAISGERLAIGAYRDTHSGGLNEGSVYVFERDQGGACTFVEVQKLTASDAAAGDWFGWSVAVGGDVVVVGARNDGHAAGPVSGSAYVFERGQGGLWAEAAKLVASDAAIGDRFGSSVALTDDTAVVGAPGDDHMGGANAGSAYVFQLNQGGPGAWGEVAKLTAGDASTGDRFGDSVSISSGTALVGARRDDHSGGVDAGSAYLFESDQSWGESGWIVASDGGLGDLFGASVAISGSAALVGAFRDDHASGIDAGAAYVFITSTPSIYCTSGTSGSGCRASLSHAGSASATATAGFSLLAAAVEGRKDGLFFFGTSGRQASPWGTGTSYQCVVPPVQRAGLLPGVGVAGACDGAFSQDLNALWCPGCPKPQKNPGAGTPVQAQLWYRDPFNSSNQTTSFSDAIEFLVGP